MAANTPISIIYNELTDYLSQYISEDYIFWGKRPDAVPEKMKTFVVIDLPTEIDDIVKGNTDFSLETTGVFYCFARAKTDSTLNGNAISDLTHSVKSHLPYSSKHIKVTNPKVLSRGYDGNNFHCVAVTFDLRTKVNSFNNN